MEGKRRLPLVEFPAIPSPVGRQLALEKDSHNRSIDMVLSAKIHDLKTTAAVSCAEANTLLPRQTLTVEGRCLS